MTTDITIDRRFNGPPDSAQGGYVAGLLAESLGGSNVEVTLRRPPPLGTPLSVANERDTARLLDGETLLAEARRLAVETDVPGPPSFEEAALAARNYPGLEHHPFPTCFACGPDRSEGDGMRLSAGPMPDRNLTATPWVPSPSLSVDGRTVSPESVWAALDCPSGWAATEFSPGREAVLGRIAARIERRLIPRFRYIITSWPLGHDGRKMYAASAVFDEDRALHALALATWIQIRS